MLVASDQPPQPAPPGQRNAAQLRAAALATGYFENYVGDGASVPWQVFVNGQLPLAFTAFLYKAYLDSRWLDAFFLHDWLYTPWGQLIGATRSEADAALYEEIARDSPFHAGIVYAAVRAGGAPYFGISTTGYTGAAAWRPMPDIALPPEPPDKFGFFHPDARGSTMATKVVMKFLGFTDKSPAVPVGGGGLQEHGYSFTESFWWPGDSAGAITNLNAGTFVRRARLLPSNTSLLGATLYDGGTGAGTFTPAQLPGASSKTDQVNIALLCRSNNPAAAHQSRFWIHNLPDDQVTGGEYTPSSPYATLVADYLADLATWQFNGQVASSQVPVFDIQTDGTVTSPLIVGVAVGQVVEIRRVYIGNGRRVGGSFIVTDIGPLPTQFKVKGWTYGYGRGGTTFTKSFAFYTLSGCVAVRAGTRKVGRPLNEYRGRKSARKIALVH